MAAMRPTTSTSKTWPGRARASCASSGPRPQMPVLRLIRERFAAREAAGRAAHRGLPARDHRDGQPGDHAQGRRRPGDAVRQQPALAPRTTSPPRWSASTASPPSPSRARTSRPTTATSTRRSRPQPQITMDDGADLVTRAPHEDAPTCLPDVIGGTEETTTGVIRLRSMADRRRAEVPDRRRQRGDDQALVRQPLRHRPEHDRRHHPRHQHPARRRTFVVGGYGWCGRGVAMRATGMGANVIVTEIDPTRALEALMDGYRVMPMAEAAQMATSSSPSPAT